MSLRGRSRAARPSPRVDRTRPAATPALDGWPSPRAPRGTRGTEPGVQPDSSAATCGFAWERASDLYRRPFLIFRRLAALRDGKSLGSPSDRAESPWHRDAGDASDLRADHGSAGLSRRLCDRSVRRDVVLASSRTRHVTLLETEPSSRRAHVLGSGQFRPDTAPTSHVHARSARSRSASSISVTEGSNMRVMANLRSQ